MSFGFDSQSDYDYPPIELLQNDATSYDPSNDSSNLAVIESIVKLFASYSVPVMIDSIFIGSSCTCYTLIPQKVIHAHAILSLKDDISLHLGGKPIRIYPSGSGLTAYTLEVPNDKLNVVHLRSILESSKMLNCSSKTAFAVGREIKGSCVIGDFESTPHILIGGQPGSGKSAFIDSIICSILMRSTPKEVRFLLIDPNGVGLSFYEGIPHLLCPVIVDRKRAAFALQYTVSEISARFKRFAQRGVRNIRAYNSCLKSGEKIMSHTLIVIDNLPNLLSNVRDELNESILQIARLGRPAGVHLIISTQRMSSAILRNEITFNLTGRIAFAMPTSSDSKSILGKDGAENLLGNGDMLCMSDSASIPVRIQGAWVSPEEIHALVRYIKEHNGSNYDVNMHSVTNNTSGNNITNKEFPNESDPKLLEATEIAMDTGYASVSLIQRRLRIGYARAGRLLSEMQKRGIVAKPDGAKPCEILITREQMKNLFKDRE